MSPARRSAANEHDSIQVLLAVRGLSAGYGGQAVIHDIDLEVHAGEVLAVLGPNGSGKSTFVKAAYGAIEPLNGTVEALGCMVTGWSVERLTRLGVGYVPQHDDTFRPLSVIENLRLGAYFLPRRSVGAAIDDVCSLFPALSSMLRRRVDVLSGGERKMVGIARALVAKPRLLFLDEPTAGLAPEVGRRVLSEAVAAAAENGSAVVLVEQRAEDALKVAENAVVFVGGRVITHESSRELLDRGSVASLFLSSRGTE
jgi:ABC-type branched-subunit amino acid transport system ATPase component